MPTQWSEAEQVPLGCIAPSFAGKSSYTVRVDVGIGPYKVLTPQQKMTGQGPAIFCYSLSKNYPNTPVSAIIEETGVFSWKAGEKTHGGSQSS